ncbi:MAG: hypothetical protein ACXWCG_11240, partial [Flavitalea sp.]
MKRLVYLIFFLIHVFSVFCQDKTSLEKFGVGFKTFLLYDLSRPPIKEQLDINPNEKGRVIQTN